MIGDDGDPPHSVKCVDYPQKRYINVTDYYDFTIVTIVFSSFYHVAFL